MYCRVWGDADDGVKGAGVLIWIQSLLEMQVFFLMPVVRSQLQCSVA